MKNKIIKNNGTYSVSAQSLYCKDDAQLPGLHQAPTIANYLYTEAKGDIQSTTKLSMYPLIET